MKIVVETHEQYLAKEGESASGLKRIIVSDTDYLWHKHNKSSPTPAQKFGTVVHKKLLERDEFDNTYGVLRKQDLPFPDSTMNKAENKAYKEALETSGKIILSEDDWNLIEILAGQVDREPELAHLLYGGISEGSVYFKDEMFDIDCKLRFDKVQPELHYLIDVKTTQSAEPESFVKEVINRDYDLQMMFYADNLRELYGELEPIIIAVEKNPPFNIVPYTLPKEIKERGRSRYVKALGKVAALRRSNNPQKYDFDGYETRDGIITLKTPKWVM